MGTAAVILGVLGFVSTLIGVPTMQPVLFFGGGGASLAAFVLGFIGRGSAGPVKAGMMLGLLGALAWVAIVYLWTTDRGVESWPDEVEATQPVKMEAQPVKAEAQPVKAEAQPVKIDAPAPS